MLTDGRRPQAAAAVPETARGLRVWAELSGAGVDARLGPDWWMERADAFVAGMGGRLAGRAPGDECWGSAACGCSGVLRGGRVDLDSDRRQAQEWREAQARAEHRGEWTGFAPRGSIRRGLVQAALGAGRWRRACAEDAGRRCRNVPGQVSAVSEHAPWRRLHTHRRAAFAAMGSDDCVKADSRAFNPPRRSSSEGPMRCRRASIPLPRSSVRPRVLRASELTVRLVLLPSKASLTPGVRSAPCLRHSCEGRFQSIPGSVGGRPIVRRIAPNPPHLAVNAREGHLAVGATGSD